MSLTLRPWLLATMVIASGVRAFAASGGAILCGETRVRVLGSGPEEIAFNAHEGEVVSATVVADPLQSGFAPWWRIADVQGHPVALSNGTHRCTGRCETAPLPRGNAFTLRVADVGRGRGGYVVSFEAVSATANGASNGPPAPACARTVAGVPDGTQPLASDGTASGTIDRAGETDTFTLDARAGETLHVEVVPTGGEALFVPAWDVFDAAGARVAPASGGTVPLATSGVVTILVTDAALRATGAYAVAVTREPPASTTSTSVPPATTSTTEPPSPTTTTSTPGEPSTTITTTTLAEPTTSTTIDAGSTTSTTTLAPASTTTSTSSPDVSTTTVTVPASTTTTLAPAYDLGGVLPGPPVGPRAGLGTTLVAAGGRLLVGAPHEDVGVGATRVRDAGALLVVDVANAVGTPSFGSVIRLARPALRAPGDGFATAAMASDGGVVVGAPGARAAFYFPNAQEETATTFVPPVAGSADGFGATVVAAGDLVVVGAPEADASAGIAYVFERATGTPHAVLQAPVRIPGARFGTALASAGSLVLIGAPGGPQVAGAAFLFDAASGALVRSLAADTPFAADDLGAAVAFAGGDPVAGVPGAGRVDRFDAATGKATQHYASPAGGTGDRFGAALATGDGLLVVGAPSAVVDGVAGGAAYAFALDTGALVAALQKPMPAADDAFGAGVTAGGGRIFVGAPGDDVGTTDGGSIYVFEGGGVVAVLRERLSSDAFGAAATVAGGAVYAGAPEGDGGLGFVARLAPGAPGGDVVPAPDEQSRRFGAALATLGPVVVVGAPGTADGDHEAAGAVHLYDGTQRQTTIRSPSPETGARFGFAVGSVDGDVLASAPFSGGADTGIVYRLDPTTGALRVTYGKPAPVAGDFFGASIAGAGGQVLVGAPQDASGGAPTGAVYLFDAQTAAIVHAIANPNPSPSQDLFGAAVALGSWIVVGAPYAGDGSGVVGTVWLFDRATGALLRRLDNPRSGRGDDFGAAVALMDDLLVVGAPLADDNAPDSGLVYLFDAGTGALRQTFRSPPQGALDHFGFAVAATPDGIVVGSPGPSRIYLFDPVAVVAAPAQLAPRLAAATAVAAPAARCGNGLVEEGEQCDDGNTVDTDDCTNACTRGPCCTLDAIATGCDDGDRCTTDILDPVGGCRYEPSGLPGCCTQDADCPDDGQCRVCVGCYIYHWDCCDAGSRCIPSNPACESKTCVDAAYCQCEGKLACGSEPIPDALRVPFASACDTLRLELAVESDGTVAKPELVLARQRTRSARAALRKTLRTARTLARSGALSRACRLEIVSEVRVVRRAIPRGRQLRRCLLGSG